MNRSLLIIACVAPLLATALQASSILETAHTNAHSLNDLVRRIPLDSPARSEELRRLSAIQEVLILFEQEMRGEGLPPILGAAFSANYSAILEALVQDRISDEYGRDLLSVHRQLLCRTQKWVSLTVRDESFREQVLDNLTYFQEELAERAIPLYEVPDSIRTPVINGYQVWLGELLAWGCECGALKPYDVAVVRRYAFALERFECAYKQDGVLYPYEREQLHKRFLKLTRETIDRFGD